MAVYDECFEQLVTALEAWDYSAVWPTGYAGVKSILFTNQWPYDRIDDMLKEGVTTPKGYMTNPIISVVAAHGTGTFRTLGGNYYDPSQPGQAKKAERFAQAYMVSTWADELLGGYDTVMAIAGQIAGCVLANRTSLPAYRTLRMQASDPAYQDRPQLWTYDQHVEGIALHSVSVP